MKNPSNSPELDFVPGPFSGRERLWLYLTVRSTIDPYFLGRCVFGEKPVTIIYAMATYPSTNSQEVYFSVNPNIRISGTNQYKSIDFRGGAITQSCEIELCIDIENLEENDYFKIFSSCEPDAFSRLEIKRYFEGGKLRTIHRASNLSASYETQLRWIEVLPEEGNADRSNRSEVKPGTPVNSIVPIVKFSVDYGFGQIHNAGSDPIQIKIYIFDQRVLPDGTNYQNELIILKDSVHDLLPPAFAYPDGRLRFFAYESQLPSILQILYSGNRLYLQVKDGRVHIIQVESALPV